MTLAVPPMLDLSESVTLSTSEAARRLLISRGRLAELVLSGVIELVGTPTLQQGRVRLSDVERLAEDLIPAGGIQARMKLPDGLLSRTMHALLHLLSDWGIGDKTSLRYAVKVDYNTVLDNITALTEAGYVVKVGQAIMLTELGKQYVEEFPRVS